MFLHVDITNCHELAKELRIEIGGYSGEIPVFICFKNVCMARNCDVQGKEVCRVPEISEKPRIGCFKWSEVLQMERHND